MTTTTKTKNTRKTINLEARSVRDRLPVQKHPHWQKLPGVSAYVGYAPGKRGGTWHGRRWDKTARDGKGAQQTLTLGQLEDHPDKTAFAQAVERVREWARQQEGGFAHGATVADACRAYVVHVAVKKTDQTAKDAERFFKRAVYGQAIGRTPMDRLTPAQVQGWFDGMVRTTEAKDADRIRRMKATANRNLARLVAALNYGRKKLRMVADSDAWTSVDKHVGVDGRRTIMLDADQCKALIAAARPDMAALMRALLLTGMRPGEAPKLLVEQFDAARGILTIIMSKTKKREVVLSDEAVEFFAQQCRDKLPKALIFAQADGTPWASANDWNRPAKAAAKAAGLPATFTLYVLRHTHISRSIHAGIDLLTVSRLVGTSLKMIGDNYGHLAGANELRQRLSAVRLVA